MLGLTKIDLQGTLSCAPSAESSSRSGHVLNHRFPSPAQKDKSFPTLTPPTLPQALTFNCKLGFGRTLAQAPPRTTKAFPLPFPSPGPTRSLGGRRTRLSPHNPRRWAPTHCCTALPWRSAAAEPGSWTAAPRGCSCLCPGAGPSPPASSGPRTSLWSRSAPPPSNGLRGAQGAHGSGRGSVRAGPRLLRP